jgi:hypothetical protein
LGGREIEVGGYNQELKRHLVAYKHLRLGVKEAGVFLHKGKEVRLGHILPRELKWLTFSSHIGAKSVPTSSLVQKFDCTSTSII